MNKATGYKYVVSAAIFTGIIGGQAFTSVAEASTQSVHAVHGVYLRSSASLHSKAIAFEQKGTDFQVTGSLYRWWHVTDANGRDGYIVKNRYYVLPDSAAPTDNTTNVSDASTSGSYTTSTALPPGATLDLSINPMAPPTADWQQKFDAVMSVAQSKLGTRYVWGHNEDRGQYGFDCSNFTAYVYHHALGYKISTASRRQYQSVGQSVSLSDLRPGDLLIFNSGGHVGIYAGNNQVIQCGGGLAKVGYLKFAPGSYWYNHLSAVKRMF